MIVASMRPRKSKSLGFGIGITLIIVGCSGQSQDADLGLDYAEAVETALKQPKARMKTVEVFPSRRDRRHDLEAIRVSFGEWNDLESCAAGGLIAEANSPLGRVRSPFERARHSQSLLFALEGCEDTMTERAWAQFQAPRKQKMEQLDEERWNAFWLSEPAEQSLGRTTPLNGSLRSDAPRLWLALIKSLESDGQGGLDEKTWYATESTLLRTATVGEALRFMQSTTLSLERVVRAVEQSRLGRTNCLQRDRRVIALMRGHYGKKLQPLMARGDQTIRSSSEALSRVIEELTPSEGIPEGMMAWASQWRKQQAFSQYRGAIRRHASHIGELLSACDETL